MTIIITIVATIFVFGLLVLFHEFGHFATAKSVGMRVDEFAVGFGPKIFSYKYGETIYSLRIIPLGGYNKIAGMEPEEDAGERSYCKKPIWARLIVISAGSLMNFVLPVILFFMVFVASGIDTPSTEPVLGSIMPDKPAAMSGLQSGDRIIKINNEEIVSWNNFVETIQVNSGKVLKVEYERNGNINATSLIPEFDAKTNHGIIGVTVGLNKYYPSIGESFILSCKHTVYIIHAMIDGLFQMFTGRTSADVSGPIGVAKMTGEVARLGIAALLQFAAFLSINLGIINLLPLPALDGGHIVTLLVEGIRRKPLSKKTIYYIQMAGFLLIITLMIFTTFNDIKNL